MNILIDFSQIPKIKKGVGVYALNLVQHLAVIDNRNHYFILIQSDEDCLDTLEVENIHLIRLNHFFFRRFSIRLILEQILMPIYCWLKHIDLIHSLHYSFPLIKLQARTVVTIHDMTFFLFPEYHLKSKKIFFQFFIKMANRFADGIIVVSDSTKRDLIRLTAIAAEKVTVIPLGRPTIGERTLAKTLNPDVVFNKYSIKRPYLLYVGTLEPRKNIQRLISAFSQLNVEFPQVQLVIAGEKGWHYTSVFDTVHKLNLKYNVVFTEYISDSEKLCLMAHAAGFVYPSLYEGFGLPVLEALAMGTQVLTSNRSSLPELVGNAAILVNPEDEMQLLKGMKNLVSGQNTKLGVHTLAQKQSGRFLWEYTAESTLNLYNSFSR